MFQASYTPAALKAMIDKPQDREAAARTVIEATGGTLHSMFFCLGKEDVVAIIEAPDDIAMAAGSMAIGASGAFSSGATTKLMTMADAQAAMAAAQPVSAANTPATG